jgi:hypothetical protein
MDSPPKKNVNITEINLEEIPPLLGIYLLGFEVFRSEMKY